MATASPDKAASEGAALLEAIVNKIQDALGGLIDSTKSELEELRAATAARKEAAGGSEKGSSEADRSLPAYLLIRGRNGRPEFVEDASAVLRTLSAGDEMAVLVPLRTSSRELQAQGPAMADEQLQPAIEAARLQDSPGGTVQNAQKSVTPPPPPSSLGRDVPDQELLLPIRANGNNDISAHDESAAGLHEPDKANPGSSSDETARTAGTREVDASASPAKGTDVAGTSTLAAPPPARSCSDSGSGTFSQLQQPSPTSANTNAPKNAVESASAACRMDKDPSRGATAAATASASVADVAVTSKRKPAASSDNHDDPAPAADDRPVRKSQQHRPAPAQGARDSSQQQPDSGPAVAAMATANAAAPRSRAAVRPAANAPLATPPDTPQPKRKATDSQASASSNPTPAKRMRKSADKTVSSNAVDVDDDDGMDPKDEPTPKDLVRDLTGVEGVLQVVGLVTAWRTQHTLLRDVVAVGGRVGTEKRTLGILTRIEGVGDASGLWQCVCRIAWADIAAQAKERAQRSGQERTLSEDVDRLVKHLSQTMPARTNLRRMVHDKLAEGRRWNELLGKHIGLLAMIPLSTGRRRAKTLTAYRALTGASADAFRAALDASDNVKSAAAIGQILHDAFTGAIPDIPELDFEFTKSTSIAKKGKSPVIGLSGLDLVKSPEGLECEDRDDWGEPPAGWPQTIAWPNADGIPADTTRCDSCSAAGAGCDCRSVRYPHEPILTYAGVAVGKELAKPEWRAPVAFNSGDPIGYVACTVVPRPALAGDITMPLVRADLPQQPVAGHLSMLRKRNKTALFLAYHIAKKERTSRAAADGNDNVVLHGIRLSGRFVLELQALTDIRAGEVLVLGTADYTGGVDSP